MEEGAAMGSPLSAVVANLYMASFEEQVVTSSPLKNLHVGSGNIT